MKYFQMVIEFEVPDDLGGEILKEHIDSFIPCTVLQGLREKDIKLISIIKPSIQVRFYRAKWRQEKKAKLEAKENKTS